MTAVREAVGSGESGVFGTLNRLDYHSRRFHETIVSTGGKVLKVMDLFCGTGGFSKGFENAGGFEVVHGIDVLPMSVETFRANHQKAFGVSGDIRKVRRSEVAEATGLKRGEVDVIIGGPLARAFPQSVPSARRMMMTREIRCLKSSPPT